MSQSREVLLSSGITGTRKHSTREKTHLSGVPSLIKMTLCKFFLAIVTLVIFYDPYAKFEDTNSDCSSLYNNCAEKVTVKEKDCNFTNPFIDECKDVTEKEWFWNNFTKNVCPNVEIDDININCANHSDYIEKCPNMFESCYGEWITITNRSNLHEISENVFCKAKKAFEACKEKNSDTKFCLNKSPKFIYMSKEIESIKKFTCGCNSNIASLTLITLLSLFPIIS